MMKKYMNNKGFTLVELMMVIAIIGILALVLIPKMSFMKNTAKESGLDTNIRIVEATATGLINKYDPNSTTGKADFAAALVSKLNSQVVNPFTKNTSAGAITAAANFGLGGTATNGYGVAIQEVTGANTQPSIASTSGLSTAKKGVVYCAVYTTSGGLYVNINGVDGNGNWYRTTDTIVE